MTDHKTSSPINLLKAPSSSSMSGPSAFPDADKGRSFDLSFSRELSRASENTASPREPLNRQRPNNIETGDRQVSPRSDRSSQMDRRDSANSADKMVKKSAEVSESSPDAADKVSRSAEKSSETANETRKPQKDDTSPDTESSEKPTRQSDDGEGVALKEAQRREVEVSVTDDAPVLEVGLTGGNIVEAELSTESPAGTDVSDAENAEVLAVSGTNDVVATTTPSLSVEEPIVSDVETASPNAQKSTAGEHLSPGQLANRQAYLFKNASMREQNATLSAQQPIADDTLDAESVIQNSRSASIAAVAVGPLAEARKDKNQRSATLGVVKVDDSAVKSTLLQTMTTEPETAQAGANRLLQADDNSAAKLAILTAAQKSEQEALKTNQTQTLKLAQQQSRSLNVTTSVLSSEPLERAPQSPDNTFLSLQGGIVTAPTATRTDAGNTQTINAPINMPILQSDADKAMAGNIRWMVNEGVKNAVVNVTPTGMGPISVSIGIEKDQMNVSIIALQGSTREALDSMLPRLREQLATQGHDSVRVDISDGRADQSDRGYGHQFAEEQNGSEQGERSSSSRSADEESDEGAVRQSETVVTGSQGLINFNESGQIRSRYDVYV